MCFKPCMFFHCCTIRHKILTNIFRILIYKNKMIVGQNEYNGASGILGNFFHEWRHHEHIPYKNEPFMENILADHSIEAFKVGHRIFQGVVISVGFGTLMQFVKGGDRKLFTNRSALNPTYLFSEEGFSQISLDFTSPTGPWLDWPGFSSMTKFSAPTERQLSPATFSLTLLAAP